MKITVETMDRAIGETRWRLGLDCHDLAVRDRAIYLRGLEDAEKVRDDSYSCGGETGDDPSTFRRGHDAHGEACAKLAKRLRKEIKG